MALIIDPGTPHTQMRGGQFHHYNLQQSSAIYTLFIYSSFAILITLYYNYSSLVAGLNGNFIFVKRKN